MLRWPGAPEIPDDGIDQDCSGFDAHVCFEDLDGDGYGSGTTTVSADPDCTDAGESDNFADCDDTDPARYVGAPEACDAIDSNCDGSLVDGFADLDGDGIPNCVDPDADGDGTAREDDCGDEDAGAYPGAPEDCDGADTDCDGDLADEFDDLDGDGLPDCVDDDVDGDGARGLGDCDDRDASVHPEAVEICGDRIDQDCDAAEVAGGDPECADAEGCGCGIGRDAQPSATGALLIGLLALRRRRA